MIQQQEIADRLGITRSSVAVHISNLTKKGCIAGKGYVLRTDGHVQVAEGDHAMMLFALEGQNGKKDTESAQYFCQKIHLLTISLFSVESV